MSSDWKQLTLGDVTSWSSGGTPKKDIAEFWNGDIPWISANSMYRTQLADSDLKITELGLKNGSRLAAKDSVLLLVRGSALHSRIPVGIAVKDVAFNQDVKALTPKTELITPWYLLSWLMAHEQFLLDSVVEYTGIGAGKLDTKRMQELPFLVPPAKEIAAVTEFAKSVANRIDLLNETNATLDAIAQAIFKSWFVDFDPVHAKQHGQMPVGMDDATAGLFPDSFEETEYGQTPKGWQVLPLIDAYQINPTRKLKKGDVASYLDMASVNTHGHSVNGTILREFGSGTKFTNGDTLLARITPCLENGKTAFVDFLADGKTGWGSTEFVVLRPKEPLPQYHGYLLARHLAFREHAIQSMSGTSGRQRIQNDVLGRFPIHIPCAKVAAAFGEIADVIQRKITINHKQAQALCKLRDTMLPRLISGQLRISDVESAVEEVLA